MEPFAILLLGFFLLMFVLLKQDELKRTDEVAQELKELSKELKGHVK